MSFVWHHYTIGVNCGVLSSPTLNQSLVGMENTIHDVVQICDDVNDDHIKISDDLKDDVKNIWCTKNLRSTWKPVQWCTVHAYLYIYTTDTVYISYGYH